MIKKEISYTDFDGVYHEKEPFWFNLTTAECIELEAIGKGGLEGYIRRLISSDNQLEIVKIIKKVILMAYGEKSIDGTKFMKNDQIRDSFAATEAYSVLFTELLTNEEECSKFMNGIAPKTKIPDKPETVQTTAVAVE